MKLPIFISFKLLKLGCYIYGIKEFLKDFNINWDVTFWRGVKVRHYFINSIIYN